MEGRQITNASLIENELIDHWQKQREKGVIYKLDIEKAFDGIHWQFLMKVIQCMAFNSKWSRWIYHNKIFDSGQWGSNRFLSQHKRAKVGRSALPLPLHSRNVGLKHSF